MKKLIPLLCLVSCSAAQQRAPSSAAVTKYCGLGSSSPLFLTDTQVGIVSDYAAAGKLDTNVFQAAWTKSCDYEVSLDVARGVKERKLYPGQFLEFVYPGWSGECNSIHRTIDPRAAREIAFAVGGGTADPGAVEEAFKSHCDAPFALQIGKDVKEGRLDLAVFRRFSRREDGCESSHRALTSEQVRDVAIAVKEGRVDEMKFHQAWSRSCEFGQAWAATAGAD